MLDTEESIQNALNEAGNICTSEALKSFDTDGSNIVMGDTTFFPKGMEPKKYQTPYGEIEILRHVYQSSRGGKTYCPLEHNARIIITSTPRFAKIVSNQFANNGSTQVIRDFKENHGRVISRSYLRKLTEAVGGVALAKEESWHYETPKLEEPVKTVAISMDGTTVLLCKDGYRETMAGTISLYDNEGKRMHITYLGAPPEYGKETFLRRMEREIAHTKKLYPDATYVGIADGAEANWTFLKSHVSTQILDFYHATGYLKAASEAASPRSKPKRNVWLDPRCHQLKHDAGAADALLEEMKEMSSRRLSEPIKEKLQSAITYFENHKHQMNYDVYMAKMLPIGSGVIEAACKTLIKQRLCNSGMRWAHKGAGIIISLRSLILTKGRWDQFWKKIDQYGFSLH